MKDLIDLEETGKNLDAEKAKEDIECAEVEMEIDDKFIHLDPEGLESIGVMNSGNWFEKLELVNEKVLEKKTCGLDKWQRKVVDIGIGYARELRKFSNGFGSVPNGIKLVVTGGTGAGKSTVIECLAQWAHRIWQSQEMTQTPHMF